MNDKLNKKNLDCHHCLGAKYVFSQWLEKALEQEGLHLLDVSPRIFKKIPVEYLFSCHCHFNKLSVKGRPGVNCHKCKGTTWLLTSVAQAAGFNWDRIASLISHQMQTLPCEYFERCTCDDNKQKPTILNTRANLGEILNLLDLKIQTPRLAF